MNKTGIGSCLLGLLIFFFISCTKNHQMEQSELEQYTLDESNDNHKVIIYQVFTRLFGNKNTTNKPGGELTENGSGKFNDFDETALQAIKEMGITHIWYTGVIEHATMTDYTAYGIRKDNPEVVKGKAGSPYAIKDYYDVNPDLAVNVKDRMEEFDNLVLRTHKAGLKVIIDFVPNHVARQYHSDAKPQDIKDLGEYDDKTVIFHPNNNFYYLPEEAFQIPADLKEKVNKQSFREMPAKASGNDVFKAQPSVHDWFETVKLNYGIDPQSKEKHFDPIPDTWNKMEAILKFWTDKGVDGFRCDMAEMVPVEFWHWVIPRIKAVNPDILFIAEIYNPAEYENYLKEGKFDYLYDKVQLYDTLKHIIQGKSTTDHITTVWQDLKGINQYMLRFLENHDEQRIASPDFAGDPFKAIPAMVVSATLYTGPVMIYFGQEVGEPGAGASGFSGDDGRSTIFDYWGVPEHQKWMNNGKFDGGLLSDDQKRLHSIYSEILNLVKDHEVFGNGKFFDLHAINKKYNASYAPELYSYLRYNEEEVFLILTNFSEKPISATVDIPVDIANFDSIQKLSGGAEPLNLTIKKHTNILDIKVQPWDYAIMKLF